VQPAPLANHLIRGTHHRDDSTSFASLPPSGCPDAPDSLTVGDMANKRVQLFVRGRVQGVFFRAAAQREARRLGIGGWVKNRNDGTIEIIAEGEEDAIKELLGWAQRGPSAARVDDVDVRWRGYTGEFSEFRIVD